MYHAQIYPDRLNFYQSLSKSTTDRIDKIQALVPEYIGEFTLQAFQQTGKGKGDAVRLGFEKATAIS
jgi:hypothetical protein